MWGIVIVDPNQMNSSSRIMLPDVAQYKGRLHNIEILNLMRHIGEQQRRGFLQEATFECREGVVLLSEVCCQCYYLHEKATAVMKR